VRFSAPVLTGPGDHQASYTMGTGFLSRRVNRPGRGVDHLTPRLKKDENNTSIPSLGLRHLF